MNVARPERAVNSTVMTPELKNACELVFQEHKTASQPVAWKRDVFRGRISTGLCEMAKETLVQKQVICFPNPARKNFTVINPLAISASCFEEAIERVMHPEAVPAETVMSDYQAKKPAYEPRGNSVTAYWSRSVNPPRLVALTSKAEHAVQTLAEPKWYLKPVFVYLLWPLLGAFAGGVIAWLMGEAYTQLFFNLK